MLDIAKRHTRDSYLQEAAAEILQEVPDDTPVATKFILGSPKGGTSLPSLHSSPAVGEEPPILLACPMACQEQTALLTHSLNYQLTL